MLKFAIMSDRYRTRCFLYCSAVAVFARFRAVEVAVAVAEDDVGPNDVGTAVWGVLKAVASDLFMGTMKDGEDTTSCEEIMRDSTVTLLFPIC
jgi:hypothetical protein